ncbi:hypothetical protein [uncultured Alistipes sp.]|uniref:hypothetical protein n=1 Tax=uncultured Alistipes sp. TaxID=538949 RepID=UPI0026130C9B|nr:hypothetical protein [uncultured Alistipes sp.]
MNRCCFSISILFIVTAFVPSLPVRADKNPFLEQIRNFPQEKIHVTTDRDSYIAGDTVWLRAHCVDAATLEPLTVSRYVYVELRTQDNLLVRRVKILQRNGIYAGYMPLPATLSNTEYVLCAYTLYMRNQGGDYLFSKAISVNPYKEPEKKKRRRTDSAFDVSFFPEGGYLIDGQPCRVGFKALGSDGLSCRVSGVVRDDKGRIMARFTSRHAGMGSFEFTPMPGRKYTAECRRDNGKPRRFALPASNNYTFVLRVESNDTSFVVSVRSAKRWRAQGLKLLVHRCGTQCYYKEWDPQVASLTFLREELPGGLYQILLLSATGEALSERLVFNRRDEMSEVRMQTTGTMAQRSKVVLNVEVLDDKRHPAQGNFALSVTDRRSSAPSSSGGIYSTLLLSSELRGVVEDPDWYFAPENGDGATGLDELLLTQGWRRYDVPKLLRYQYQEPYYPLEAGQEITGRIERTNPLRKKKKLDRYTMQMLVPQNGYATSCPIAEDGTFALNGFDFPDSTTFVLRPTVGNRTITDARILITPDSFPEYRVLPRLYEPDPVYVAQARQYIEQKGQADMRNILIDTVVVTAKRPDDGIDLNAPEHRLAARSWDAEQIKETGAGTILDFISRMPGMQVTGRQVYYKGHTPAFMVDGRLEETVSVLSGQSAHGEMDEWTIQRQSQKNKGHMSIGLAPKNSNPSAKEQNREDPVYSQKRGIQYFDNFDNVPDCLYYPIEQVARIDLIDRNQSTLWGANLRGGIIAITMKKGKALAEAYTAAPSPDMSVFTPLGFQTPAEFYAPTYETEKARRSMVPDYRTTLYWNPSVVLDEFGRATVEFYTSDAPADYSIMVEGVSQQGKIIDLDTSFPQK